MPTVPESLALAAQHHQAGNIAQAAAIYQQVLAADPQNADAANALGIILYTLGKHQEAVSCFQYAVQMQPGNAALHTNLGNVLSAVGRHHEAAASHQRALEIDPLSSSAHNNLGAVLFALGNLEGAIQCWREAVRLWPDYADAHGNIISVLTSQGRVAEAVDSLREMARLKPSLETYNQLGNVLCGLNELDESERCYRSALSIQPENSEILSNLGVCLLRQDRPDEALTCCEQAVRLRPGFANAHNNLGTILERQGKLDEAVAAYRQAICCQPDYAEAYCNVANVVWSRGQLDEAMQAYEKAVRLQPNSGDIHWNCSLMRLRLGDFEHGWPEYEWRWQARGFSPITSTQPLWDGSPLAGRTILVLAEQGQGDTLQFIRFAALVKKTGGRVVVLCHAPLVELVQSVKDIDQVLPLGAPPPPFDVYAPLLSLPGLCKTTLTTIPAAVPYLHVGETRITRWREVLGTLGKETFKVGIAWQGNPIHKGDKLRSFSLNDFERLARLERVRLVSLQKGPGTEQLKALAGRFAVLDLESQLGDDSQSFTNIAAIVKNLHMVISCDTSIAHLAGALAAPTWVGLPFISDWRWFWQREDSPWYPTMRLFRQRQYGQWDSVFERMAAELCVMARF